MKFNFLPIVIKVFILDGDSEMDAHLQSDLAYLIC